MSQFFSSLQSQFLFGRPVSAWHVLDDSDLERLSLPGFLQDQVFQVSFVPGAMLHCFEVRVSEQTPRDAYDHIARGLARLGPSAFAANIVHGRSPNAHLIFWRETHGQRFHHLEMDFSRSNKYHREVLAFLRKPIPANFEALFAGLESAASSKAFFKTLQRCLKDVPCNQPSAYYGLVDLLLKVIFLIFVQRKGWLNFDPGYLDNKMRACDRRGLSITCPHLVV